MSPARARPLCSGMLRTREDSSLYKTMTSIFFTNIGRAVADDCCTGFAIKRYYHHRWLYFLDAI